MDLVLKLRILQVILIRIRALTHRVHQQPCRPWSSALEIELGGTLAGDFDQLSVSGDVDLTSGTLDVSLIDGFGLSHGQSFLFLLIGGSLQGGFSSLGEGGLVGNYGADLYITYQAGDGNDIALFTNGEDCQADPLVISDQDYYGTLQILSESSLTATGDVILHPGADVTFEAGGPVSLGNGFRVQAGSVFHARNSAVSCTGDESPQPPVLASDASLTDEPVPADDGPEPENAAPERAESASIVAEPRPIDVGLLPIRLQRQLQELGLTEQDIGEVTASEDLSQIVFSTELALLPDDSNSHRDVYRYQSADDSLWLVSQNLDGQSGNGPSDQPRIDGWGEYIVYRSLADDLHWLPDNNEVADVYLYHIPTGNSTRASWGETGGEAVTGAGNPDLGGERLEVVFDRQDTQTGLRGIFSYEPGGVHAERRDSGDCDAHHPVISADGGTLAHLCSAQEVDGHCEMRFYHLSSGQRAVSACPPDFGSGYRLFFGKDASGIRWIPPEGADSPVELWTVNPLYESP